ncbi:MAG TPA: hypothetical protein PLK82_06245, partial [Bacteroidales bacterium]|nr:hypothetical protein [Bacteroidales bacterium]
MKRFILLTTMAVATLFASAQSTSTNNNDEITPIFGKGGKAKLGWFVGLDPGYTQIDNRDAWLGGISVGMIIDHNFALGLTGRGWTNRDDMYFPNVTDTAGGYLEGGYGGLLLEYTLFPKSVVHVTFPVMIGAGGTSFVSEAKHHDWDDKSSDWENDDCGKTLDSDSFFVIEPGVRAEVNVFKFMRLNAGVSYRYTSGFDMVRTSSDMLNNFTATVGL